MNTWWIRANKNGGSIADSQGSSSRSSLNEGSSSGNNQLVQTTGWEEHATIFVTCLFVLAAVVVKIVYHRSKYIAEFVPESCVFILLGSAIDCLLSETSTALARLKPTFTIDIFFAVLLPPIMLESAYSLNQKHFYLNIVPILLYAVIGTVINVATIGPSLYAVSQLDTRKWLNMPNVSLLELTIFGTSLSAIDPVSVLAIFKDLRVKRSLYYLVFGESLLNDAVVLVIHRILFGILQTKQTFGPSLVLLGLAKFLIVSTGSLLIGVSYGVASALLTLATRHVEDVEPVLLLLLAYTSYVSAEIFEWSGVVSIIGCGLAEFAFHNISTRSRIAVHNYITALSATADVVIFMFIGMVLVQSSHYWNVAFIMLTLAFCVLYRCLSVLSLTYIVNKVITTATYVSLSEQLLMVHAGLRGAIAYALISMLSNKEQNEPDKGNQRMEAQQSDPPLSHRLWLHGGTASAHSATANLTEPMQAHVPLSTSRLLQTTTLVIILVTVFLMGSTTKPLLKYLNIKREQNTHGVTIFQQLNEQLLEDTAKSISKIVSDRSNSSWLYRMAQWLNARYFRKVFLRKSKCINEDYFEQQTDSEQEEKDTETAPLETVGVDRDPIAAHKQRAPLTASSLAVTAARPYQAILRKYLAKQLRDQARGILVQGKMPPRGQQAWQRDDRNGTDTMARSGRPILSSRKGPFHRERHEYGASKSDWTANQHNQLNRINLSEHTPERVVLPPHRNEPSRGHTSRPADWNAPVRVVTHSARAVQPKDATVRLAWPPVGSNSATRPWPHSTHSDWSLSAAFAALSGARSALRPSQTTSPPERLHASSLLVTANGVARPGNSSRFQLLPPFDSRQRSSQNGSKRYRSSILPYNESARSDT